MPSLQHTPTSWHGSLFAEGVDDAGLMYRRNRYYDPATGQFTQEDPLGLAGGMNTYGFASGDPVNFSDPFGLSCLVRGNCTQSNGGVEEADAHERWVRSAQGVVDDAGFGDPIALLSGGEEVEEGKAAVTAVEEGTVVIGENMKDRVIPYAEKIGAKYYNAVGKRAENWMANNRRWIERVMKAGKKVVDIGEDASRTKRSDAYQMETRTLQRNNYPVTKDPQPPSEP